MKATKCQKFPIKCERVRLRGWGLYTWQMMIRSDDPFMLIHHRRCSLLFRFFHIFHRFSQLSHPQFPLLLSRHFLLLMQNDFFFRFFGETSTAINRQMKGIARNCWNGENALKIFLLSPELTLSTS